MASSDLVKGFLSQLEPEDVPFEYIAAASIRDPNDQEIMLKGEELRMLMSNHPNYAFVKDARIYINLQKVVKAIGIEVEYIFERVDMMFGKEEAEAALDATDDTPDDEDLV